MIDAGNALEPSIMSVFTAALEGFSLEFGMELNSITIGGDRVCFKKFGNYSLLLHCDARVGENAGFGMLKEICNLLEVYCFCNDSFSLVHTSFGSLIHLI